MNPKDKDDSIFGLASLARGKKRGQSDAAKADTSQAPVSDVSGVATDSPSEAPDADAVEAAQTAADADDAPKKKRSRPRRRSRRKRESGGDTSGLSPEGEEQSSGENALGEGGTQAPDDAPAAQDATDATDAVAAEKPAKRKRPRRRRSKKSQGEGGLADNASPAASGQDDQPDGDQGAPEAAACAPETEATASVAASVASDESPAMAQAPAKTAPLLPEPQTAVSTPSAVASQAIAAPVPQPVAPRPAPAVPPRLAPKPEPEPEPEPMPEFEDLTLETAPESIRAAVARAGWDKLMPVQAKALPWVLAKKDVMVQARTGSGKTGAFALPLVELLDVTKDCCQALVLVPTRELARQVEEEAHTLFGDCGLRTVAVYGGVGYGPQRDAFRKGAHLVVGTPGRILDHLMQRNLTLDNLRVLVFDEADRMLSIGFYPDMKQVQRYLPERYSAFMFSATFPPNVLRLSNEFLYKPGLLSLSGDSVHVAEVAHVFYEVPAMGKERCLIRIIETENPSNGIIFCNTKADVHFVTAVLQQFGYNADELSADLSQARREQVLQRVRSGTLRFLVATDVAARGIDIPELSHVFLYEPPEDHESYIHRAGRTGRAGAAGVAISLVDIMQKLQLQRIGAQYKIEFERRELPTDEDVQAVVGTRLTALLENRMRTHNVLEKERMRRFELLARSLADNEELTGLVAMLLDEVYQATLHATPLAPEPLEEDSRRDGGSGKAYNEKRRGRRGRN